MQIAILNFEDVVPSSVMGPADILDALMRAYPSFTGKQLKVNFKIDFITEEQGRLWRKPFDSREQHRIKRNDVYDLVIVPAMMSNKIEMVLAREHILIEWIRQQHQKRAELASICVGAFMLAATGALNGKKATTHWRFAEMFSRMYPEVVLLDDKIIVDQGHIYTCGGAFSFTTLMMYLIEKFCGHEAAIIASKTLMINMHQQPQSTFSIFQLQRGHADEAIKKAQSYIEKNYQQGITIEKMAELCNMSIRNFIRRFEQATSNTPLEYQQRVRIEAAKKQLENRNDSIEQVAMQCGYEDTGFFRKIFKRHVAMTPKEYQEKYGKSSLKQVTSLN